MGTRSGAARYRHFANKDALSASIFLSGLTSNIKEQAP
jgi:hypothetical protein